MNVSANGLLTRPGDTGETTPDVGDDVHPVPGQPEHFASAESVWTWAKQRGGRNAWVLGGHGVG